MHVSLHVEARFCLHRCVSKVGWQKNNHLLLFMDPLLPSIFRKSVRLITPHIPIPIPIMYWGISVPDPSNIMHIIRILWSVSDKEVTLARWATTNCHWVSVFGKWDLPFFSPFNHFSLFLSFPFSVLSGNLPCNCCSLHHRIAWLHSSHSYRLPVTEWGASPTGHKPPPWSPSHVSRVPFHSIAPYQCFPF